MTERVRMRAREQATDRAVKKAARGYKGPGLIQAKCPFYQGERPKAILCEGLDGAAVERREFENEQEKMAYLEQECSKVPRRNRCPHCRAMMDQYSAEDADP